MGEHGFIISSMALGLNIEHTQNMQLSFCQKVYRSI